MRVTVSRRSHFNAAHQLVNQNWDKQKNELIFGKCANPNFHGHNYEVIVSITGEIDPETGFVMNLNVLKKLVQEEVEDYLDHKNLNLEIEEFKSLNPTAENIVVIIWKRLKAKLNSSLELKVTLFETSRNFVEYSGN